MSARFKAIPSKGIYLPNASHLGFGKYLVHAGDVLTYRETYQDGSFRTRIARALELVTHDHEGKEYRAPSRGTRTKAAPKLRVLAFNDLLDHAFERWIDLADVSECRAASPEHGAFARAMLSGPLPSPAACVAASNYGTLCGHYFGHVADEHGNLPENWRERSDAHHAGVIAEQAARRASQG